MEFKYVILMIVGLAVVMFIGITFLKQLDSDQIFLIFSTLIAVVVMIGLYKLVKKDWDLNEGKV